MGGPAQDSGSTDSAHLEPYWAELRAGLRSDIGARMFDQWLKPARLGAYCPMTETLDILVASEFSANFVSAQFGDRLRLAWRSAHAGVRDIRIVRAPEASALRVLAVPAPAPEAVAAPARAASCFQPRHDFESFVTGESNQLACSAAQAMAAEEQPRFTPLFIHGGTGQGKTHLLHAIAGAYLAHTPGSTVVYMSAERFMMEFVNAMRANETMAFKARLRAARLLLIDDIQFIAGKGATQEEFLHTINELVENGARIVISADRAPQQLDGIDPRILSRLAGGLVADIQPANIDLRLAILEAKRLVAGDPPVPDAIIDFLARSVRSNIRELEGAFNKLLAYGQLTGRTIDMEFAQAMLADTVRANARRITVDEIQKACAAHYRIDPAEMRSKRRARAIARPRQVAMYLAKKMTPRSLPEIGRIFGGRDHSTVIHAVRTIEALRESNPDIDADVRALLRQLES
ncbi:MAG: chromosomal replication initiator protein DnaA [Sphingobium sp.]|uniref:chromosomal replication initiator protein DnaA n=1 Tax=Sphingobium sp. TaxID=1912891 RepID=UPI0029A2FD19|nr:chromosomal replication initiator protein DnaA [Sphingobium sp.]MDX3910066.1 chromosomal replication initiator protein DnaA [Sphingobium sp.]